MAQIFISYRRADSVAITERIYDRLIQAFGKSDIFKDTNSISIGPDFRGSIREATSKCRIMLVIIGPSWVSAQDNGNRRLDNPNDFVRLEVEAGLQRDEVLVVPVLVSNAKMPSAAELPLSLVELAYKNAATVHDDPYFHKDMDHLIEHLKPRIKTRSISNMDWRWLVVAIFIPLVAALITIIPSMLDRFKASEAPSPNETRISVAQAQVTRVALIENEYPIDLPTPTMISPVTTKDPILRTSTPGLVIDNKDPDFNFSYPGDMTKSGDNGQFIFTDSLGNTINLYAVSIYRRVLPNWQKFILDGGITDSKNYCSNRNSKEKCEEVLENFVVRVGFKLITNWHPLEESPKIDNELTRAIIALEQRNQHGVAYLIDIDNGNWTVITVLIDSSERTLPESLTNSLAEIAGSIVYSGQ